MRGKVFFILSVIILYATGVSAQRIVENARRDAILVPARGVPALTDRKACAIANRSPDRTITVRVEESISINDFVEKRIREVAKIGPKDQKFIGYTGCETDALSQRCVGYRIMVAYYDEVRIVPHMKASPPMAAHAQGDASGMQGDSAGGQSKSN